MKTVCVFLIYFVLFFTFALPFTHWQFLRAGTVFRKTSPWAEWKGRPDDFFKLVSRCMRIAFGSFCLGIATIGTFRLPYAWIPFAALAGGIVIGTFLYVKGEKKLRADPPSQR